MKRKANKEEKEDGYGARLRDSGTRGDRQKTGINHNYNQRARKLHEVRPLWPRDSWLPASHENLSPNFGFLQGRCLLLLCIRVASFMVFHEFPGEGSFTIAGPRLASRYLAPFRAGSSSGRTSGIERRLFAERFLSR